MMDDIERFDLNRTCEERMLDEEDAQELAQMYYEEKYPA
jgi:hypothetical protein